VRKLRELGISVDASGLSDGSPLEVSFSPAGGGLLHRQQEAATQTLLALQASPFAAMLVLPCGFGKTVIALWLAAQLGRKTLVVVHKEFLLEQWRERIATFVPDARIGILQGSKVDTDGKDFVIAMVQSLAGRAYESHVVDSFGFLVLDEAHHLGARFFSQVFFAVKAKYVLGLTATPKRKDNCTQLLHDHMGQVAYQAVDVSLATASVVQVKVSSPWQSRKGMELDKGQVELLKSKLAMHDAARNSLLVEWCLRAVRAGRRCMLLSHRTKHLELLKHDFDQFAEATSALYVGGMTRAAREDAAVAQCIFGGFAFAQEGLDIPELDFLVLATPAADVVQAVGRILRHSEDKKPPLVVDVVDDACANFVHLANSRLSYYKRAGFATCAACSLTDFSALDY
jgi:superfamily II DNA or RNA helicase